MKTITTTENGITINTVIYEPEDFRSPTEQENLLQICYSCDEYQDSICKACGCIVNNIMGPKNKNCPLNRW